MLRPLLWMLGLLHASAINNNNAGQAVIGGVIPTFAMEVFTLKAVLFQEMAG